MMGFPKQLDKYFFVVTFFLFSYCSNTAKINPPVDKPYGLLDSIIKKSSNAFLQRIATQDSTYHIQLIYTQINRDSLNNPTFSTFFYSVDTLEYYYPASLVKLPTALLALEKLNELDLPELTKSSYMFTDSAHKCQRSYFTDESSESKKPSIEQYIKKMLLVSDNNAYSRVFEFLGADYINTKLHDKGYKSSYIIHRFDAQCGTKENRYTNPIRFFNDSMKLVYSKPPQIDTHNFYHPLGVIRIGNAYVDANNKLVTQPKDFTFSNYISLQDVHRMVVATMFPTNVDKAERFAISSGEYDFIRKYLAMMPYQSQNPAYNRKEYYDAYKKYLFWGADKNVNMDTTVKIFNIVGQSYGFLSDCAYIVDFKNNVEFFLSAAIYVNKDGVLNDGKYEYKEIGFPFLKQIGQAVYNYEVNRTRKYAPNLQQFRYK
ncbi:MAG: serine hydrolase [Bacteroidetes bacterium]|nr:serine hydrolase [Bacteroidota bacterium]